MTITKAQRQLIIEVIAAELAQVVALALAAGASQADVDAELNRRIRKIREAAR